jgi:checkpoint serine/threonine-protein kinase
LHVFQTLSDSNNEHSTPHPLRGAINPKTGRLEVVYVDLEQVYPNANDPTAAENSFEELRARHRGWLDHDWAAIRREKQEQLRKENDALAVSKAEKARPVPLAPKKVVEQASKPQTVPLKGGIEDDLVLNDENQPPSQAELEQAKAAKKARREERANRTRKIQVMEVREVKAETQTSKLPHYHQRSEQDDLIFGSTNKS